MGTSTIRPERRFPARRGGRGIPALGRSSSTPALVLWDAALALGALVVAEGGLPRGIGAALVLTLSAPLTVALAGGYEDHRSTAAGGALLALRLVQAAGCAVFLAWLLTSRGSQPLTGGQGLVAWLLLPPGWLLGRRLALLARSRHPERVLLIGSGQVACRVVDVTRRNPELGLRIVCALDDHPLPLGPDGPPVVGSIDDLRRTLEVAPFERVVIAFSARSDEEILPLLRECDAAGVHVDVVPRFFELVGQDAPSFSLGGLPLVRIRAAGAGAVQALAKRGIDIAASVFLLVLAAPLALLVAVAIRMDDAGPVLFRQERVGRGGRPFRILKFRTMRAAEEAPPDPEDLRRVVTALKRSGSGRVTRVGRLLRRLSLDELPQLWNVLGGQMSLVGPRPLRPFEVAGLGDWEQVRQEMRPGLTGLWQVLGRSEVEWEERMQLDYDYVRHWSLRLDLRILADTVPAVVRRRGAV